MPFSVYEMWDSRNTSIALQEQQATLKFVGYGDDEEATARAGFIAVIPSTFFGLLLDNYKIDPKGGLLWYCEAYYKSTTTSVQSGLGGTSPPPPPPAAPSQTDPLGPEYSWDISAVTETVYQSYETVSKKRLAVDEAMSVFAPDTKRAIGLSMDGDIKGCETFKPYMEWGITRTFGYVTLGYLDILHNLVGKHNHATFYGRAAGSQLFMGASGSPRGKEGQVAITFKFAYRPNETDIEVAGDDQNDPGYIGKVNRKGWEHLWVMYHNSVDEGALALVQVPFAVYIERVTKPGDFSTLGIGT